MQPPLGRKPNRPVEGSATSIEPTIDIERESDDLTAMGLLWVDMKHSTQLY